MNNSDTQNFLSILEGYGANLTVHEATRLTTNSATWVDNFITNLNIYDTIVVPSHISGHTAQLFSFSIGEARFKSVEKQIHLINESTIKNFSAHLFIGVWVDLFVYLNILDVGLFWDSFFNKYTTILDTSFSLVVVNRNPTQFRKRSTK